MKTMKTRMPFTERKKIREEEQILDNLYLLLAGMMMEEQTRGEFNPFRATRRHFLECMNRNEMVESCLQAVA